MASNETVRFSITMPADLLNELDRYSERRGITSNRSETVRDIVRSALVHETVEDPTAQVFGTLTMVFDHHANDLRDKLDDIQHAHCDEIISSMHVHVDAHNCLEVIIMRGQSSVIHSIADALLGTKGVLNGELVVTAISAHEPNHDHEGARAHTHGHEHEHASAGDGHSHAHN